MSKKTAGLKLLTFVWENHPHREGGNWSNLNHCMFEAMRLAVGSGMEFCCDDLDYLEDHFRTGYWIGVEGLEDFYSMAIVCENAKYIAAYEEFRDRKAFVANNVTMRLSNYSGFVHLSQLERARSRVGVGFIIKDYGTVSSFNGDTIIIIGESKNPNIAGKGRKLFKLKADEFNNLFPAKKKK